MNGALAAAELQRERWQRSRALLEMVDPESEEFGVGGLARFLGDPGVRLLILPSDPHASVVRFDDRFWDWWMEDRANPFEGAAPTDWGRQSMPTVGAGVRFHSRDGKWNWESYLALHRSGALEFGLGGIGFQEGRGRNGKTQRGFFLSTVVGRAWVALRLYEAVVSRYADALGPWEVTLGLSRTKDAHLGNVAEGWSDFGDWFPREAPRCPETNLLLHLEVEDWPQDEGIRDLAFDFGGMIEDAWGRKERRFLIAEGHDGAGMFDASRYS